MQKKLMNHLMNRSELNAALFQNILCLRDLDFYLRCLDDRHVEKSGKVSVCTARVCSKKKKKEKMEIKRYRRG